MAVFKSAQLEAVGYQQITNLSSVVTLVPPGYARAVLLQAEGENIRWRDDGENPTSTVGMILSSADTFLFYNGPFNSLRLIEAAVGAILNITYYR